MNNEHKLKRAMELLKATYDILQKCDQTPFVLDPMQETAFYDGIDCDGTCLMVDIGYLLGIEEDT